MRDLGWWISSETLVFRQHYSATSGSAVVCSKAISQLFWSKPGSDWRCQVTYEKILQAVHESDQPADSITNHLLSTPRPDSRSHMGSSSHTGPNPHTGSTRSRHTGQKGGRWRNPGIRENLFKGGLIRYSQPSSGSKHISILYVVI